jgi:protein SCO1/2
MTVRTRDNFSVMLARHARALSLGMIGACAMWTRASDVMAQEAPPLSATETPRELEGVGITEHLNETIPLDLTFADEQGQEHKLRDFLAPGRPVILVLGYYRCPMLCNLTRSGLVEAMNELDWSAGEQFSVLFVSINPDEGPSEADIKKQAYLLLYDRPAARQGLHFLTGRQRDIELLAKATGFGYRYDPASGDYAHTSTIMFVTPDGRLSRYMNDVKFQPRDVRLALIEASEGAIGSPMDKFLLFMCYHYDPLRGSYAASAWKIMRLGAAGTAVLLALGLCMLWWRGSRWERHPTSQQTNNSTSQQIQSLSQSNALPPR